MPLTSQQSQLIEYAKVGHSMLVAGRAGTGKTSLISALGELYRGDRSVVLTAMSHQAAVVHAESSSLVVSTLHSWAGLASLILDPSISREAILNSMSPAVKQRWTDCRLLIIDEVSMLSDQLFDLIDSCGRTIRAEPLLPFGGIQPILCGDMGQLPPIRAKWFF